MTRLNLLLWSVVLAAPLPAFAAKVDEASIGEAVERHLTDDERFTQWVDDAERIATQEGDTLATRETEAETLETVKLSDLVPPIHFESGVAQIPTSTVASINDILARMGDRLNVRVHLIGHADNQPLSPALVEVYGDNLGLSRERAGQVAEHFQQVLTLPPEAISYTWAGDTQPVATNRTAAGRAQNRRVEVEVWYDEVRAQVALEEFLVPHEIKRVKVCRMETVCKLRYVDGYSRRARIQNLVAPLRYDSDRIEIGEAFVERIRQGFSNLEDKHNVVVKFVGYTDDRPLAARDERLYGDHAGLSKARARRVALAVQDALGLPTAAVDSDGRGRERPLRDNATAAGQAVNRRVEVEFWYDDPLQELPDEPQLCPDDEDAERVTRTHLPTGGPLADIRFEDGAPVVPEGYADRLAGALAEVADKTNPRLRFVGYTRNERLPRRTAGVYGDDIGLSASRARRAMERIAEVMQLDPEQTEFEGRGFVHADDVVNAGFVQGATSHVAVQVVYDELAVTDDYEGVDVTRITRELEPENPLSLNLMRITVDGKPIDDPRRSSADIQRCTDVALNAARIQFGFDNLRSAPRLSVAAEPQRIALTEPVEFTQSFGPAQPWKAPDATPVHFRMYSNYASFIERAEVRIFANGQSVESEPLDVLKIGVNEVATWKPESRRLPLRTGELAFVLRAYGSDGNFDETRPQPLYVVNAGEESVPAPQNGAQDDPALFAAFGENDLSVHNIALGSGTVSVRGKGVEPGQQVLVAGRPVPVGADGEFVAEEVLPDGSHTVEVAVVDEEGNGELYLRDLEFKNNDWFYVGMADVTVATNDANGPIDLLQGRNALSDPYSNVDGRLAFFVNGKFGEHWKLTASADTREGPLEDVFKNFLDKSPDQLFRRLDEDHYYPTFGDDATVEELAPSMGKFYVRLARGDDYGQWGNFKVGYMNNELAQVDRGLYGANVHYQSAGTTEFGERRFAIDGFAAEPGTVASREEFRGTGGSLYYLERQDILPGSERARIELRDKGSGIVTGVINLTPALDYDIDYLQGRVLLSDPLASTAGDHLLVRSGGLSGDAAYLVVRYEYTPGFDDVDAVATGAQAHYWVGDHVKLGMTANVNELSDTDSSLSAADLTLRMTAGTWLKLQHARSDGLVSLPKFSDDGGYAFATYDPLSFVNAEADAGRVDLSVDFEDVVDVTRAKLTLYAQALDEGYSAPGLTALGATENVGGTFDLPIGSVFSFRAKVDHRSQALGVETKAQEYNAGVNVFDHWNLSVGYRLDSRTDNSINVPLTQEQGEREDAVVQIGYDPDASWSAYLFAQDTLSATGDRPANARQGIGGKFRPSEKLGVEVEYSDGDLGKGGRLGTTYTHSDHTSLYMNYALENEQTIGGLPSARGREGNLVAGIKSRLGDSTSVFLEERYQHNDRLSGLTHGTGIDFSPNANWQLGVMTDIGTLEDVSTGAETERHAGGVKLAFNTARLNLTSGIEYRNDDTEQLDQGRTERTTWLYRNSFKFQLSDAARLTGKFNHSESESSLGTFYDGGYTEGVVGFAYRPVKHDRLNALAKYTYFYNVPTTDQITLQNIAAEFIQKSHVAALDLSYDVTSNFTLGGKYAYRLGEVSLDRENPEFFDNDASLVVLRGDLRFRKNWEVLLEGRVLDMADLNERRSGALATVSRYFGDHIKVGLGYNFTDFSDDLTDLSFDNHGLFLNLTGSM